jgi:hypothetical protein
MVNDPTPSALISRFPGPLRLVPSRRKWLLVLAGCLAFVTIGIFFRGDNPVVGWLSIAFFGLGVPVAGAMLLPGAAGLVLDADGFDVTNMFRRYRVRWINVTGFTVASVPPSLNKMVVYDDAAGKHNLLGEISTGLVGRNAGLPDTYGMAAADLAQLMAGWRERAAGPDIAPR